MSATAVLRANPLVEAQAALQPQWMTLGAMRLAAQFDGADAAHAITAGIGDLTFLKRSGVKGPGAARWLAEIGLPLPESANTWLPIEGGGVIARLGRSEFLIEDGETGSPCARIESAVPAPGVYPVPRQDAEVVLIGSRVNELLLQTCAMNFAALDLSARPVVLTSMVGVGVTVLPQQREVGQAAGPIYRIWCDGTYGAYLWQTLVEVARDLGGGPVGHENLLRFVDLR